MPRCRLSARAFQSTCLRARFACELTIAHSWLFSPEPTASARIFGWIATLMEYSMQIEYKRNCENAIADALSRLDSVSINAEVPSEYARNVQTYACPVAKSIVPTRAPTGSRSRALIQELHE